MAVAKVDIRPSKQISPPRAAAVSFTSYLNNGVGGVDSFPKHSMSGYVTKSACAHTTVTVCYRHHIPDGKPFLENKYIANQKRVSISYRSISTQGKILVHDPHLSIDATEADDDAFLPA